MKKSFIFILLAFTGCKVFAQNYLFESNCSGFHIAGQLGTSSSNTVLGIRPGYTFNGKTTIGLVVGSENITDLDLNSRAIRPYLDFLALKQDRDIPMSLNLGVHYQYNSFPKLTGLSISTFGISTNLLHAIEAGNSILIVPSIGVAWDRSTLNLLGVDVGENSIGVGLSMAAKFNNLYIEPVVSFRKGGTQFGISIGVAFTN